MTDTLTTHGLLNARDVMALAEIIKAVQKQEKVVYLRTSTPGDEPLEGHARSFFGNAEGTRGMGPQTDLRDAYLRITHRSGFEGFYPVADLIEAAAIGTFAIYDWS